MITRDSAYGVYENVAHNISTAVVVSTCLLIILAFVFCFNALNRSILDDLLRIFSFLGKLAGRAINNREIHYHRSLEIGKLHSRMKRVHLYRLLNDLVIDLGLRRKGATPYSFVFMAAAGTLVVSIVASKIIFNNITFGLAFSPLTLSFVIASFYTRANVKHDLRIEAVLESENIISNSLSAKGGIKSAVKKNLEVFPEIVKEDFLDFVDNIDNKNYSIQEALKELSLALGGVSEEFIDKCLVFEEKETKGMADMFQDIVKTNTEKMILRAEAKRQFENVRMQIVIINFAVILFLIFFMVSSSNVRQFFLHTAWGQWCLAFDIFVSMGIFVYLTYLRAREI
ncbi:hypothetical protein AGMMS49975_17360 [Clostridia bacterium]|nr:hypothetical protein AGMMS49975_17360 [Clostridia bacterium]